MRKHIYIIITALLGLASYDGETIEDLKEQEKPARPASKNILPSQRCIVRAAQFVIYIKSGRYLRYA
jgi:hypothetical protein